MLTLKSLTVVPIASCIGSLFFAPFYLGESSFSELVDSYMPTFNWSIFIFDLPTFSFHFDFEWNFVFQWLTDLELNFQIPMLVSFGLLLFDYSSKLVWFIYKTTKKSCCKINKKPFHCAAWAIMLPLKFGSFSFIVCEYLWELLVLVTVVMMVAVKVALYGFLLIIYNLMFCCVPLTFAELVIKLMQCLEDGQCCTKCLVRLIRPSSVGPEQHLLRSIILRG